MNDPDPATADRLIFDTGEFETNLVSNLVNVFTETDHIFRRATGLTGVRGAKSEPVKFVAYDDLAKVVRMAVHDTIKVTSGGEHHLDPDVYAIAKVVGSTLRQARHRHSEALIAKLVDALADTHDPVAKVSTEIGADNAAARIRFMNNFTAYTSEEVTRNAGSQAKNKSQLASRWKSEGRIFSVPWRNQEHYPAFQFKEGRPLPVIAQILAALPDEMSPWEIAFWFVSTNSWLDGEAPRSMLGKSGDKVVEAARSEAAHAAG